MFRNAYKGAKVLITGDTGFKGSWLALWLSRLGARVDGLALQAEHSRGLFVRAGLGGVIAHRDGDILDRAVVEKAVERSRPDIVFHLAAQALVRRAYRDPLNTLEVNIQGTAHLLEALRKRNRKCAVVVVTSDKCYENRESTHRYRESDPMGGHDPYSASKACAEIVCSAYHRSFFDVAGKGRRVSLATARAGNVIGPGDWAEDRIVPDAVRALLAGQPVKVRNPGSVRPWQHVFEPVAGYLWLGARLLSSKPQAYESAWNFGPSAGKAYTVKRLVETFITAWGEGDWRDISNPSAPHEAGYLSLSIDKSKAALKWKPVWSFENAVRRTAQGYLMLTKKQKNTAALQDWGWNEIEAYVRDADRSGLEWAR